MREPELAGPVRPRLLGPDSGERALLLGRDIGEPLRLLGRDIGEPLRLLGRDAGERLLLLGRDSGERLRLLLGRDAGERLRLLGGDSGERSLLLGCDETGGGGSCSSETGACCIAIGVGKRSPPLDMILIIIGAWGTWGAGIAGADTRRLPDARDGDVLVRDLCLASAKLQSRLARSVKITNVWTNFMFKNSSFISVSVTQ